MSSMKKYILYAVLAMFLGGMVLFATKAYTQAILYEELTTEMVTLQGAQEQAMLQIDRFAKSILGDFYNDQRQVKFEKLKESLAITQESAQRYTRYFMYLLGALLLSFFFISLRAFTFFGAIAAMITLIFGLITPILMVTIHQEVEYLGDIVLSFESKGVMGSIEKLWHSGDIVVAMVILLFSVIIPILKVSALVFVSVFMENKFAHSIVKFFKAIGKWSMVDVFVVAVFLVYLTANKGDVSRAEVEVGLYFFLAYVIVSMLVSLSADRMLHRK